MADRGEAEAIRGRDHIVSVAREVLGSGWSEFLEDETSVMPFDRSNYGAIAPRLPHALVLGKPIQQWCACYFLMRPQWSRVGPTGNSRVTFSFDLLLLPVRDPRNTESDSHRSFVTEVGYLDMGESTWRDKTKMLMIKAASRVPMMHAASDSYCEQLWSRPSVLPTEYQLHQYHRARLISELHDDPQTEEKLRQLLSTEGPIHSPVDALVTQIHGTLPPRLFRLGQREISELLTDYVCGCRFLNVRPDQRTPNEVDELWAAVVDTE